MPNPGLDESLFFIFFIYGLAFLGMGVAMALESRRTPVLLEGLALRGLAAFGLIHGAHEWLESYLLQAQSFGIPPAAWLPWVRIGLLITSFAALLLYALLTLRLVTPADSRKLWPALFLAAIYLLALMRSAILAFQGGQAVLADLLDTMARYLLAIPGGLLAGISLYIQAGRAARASGASPANDLRLAALGFWFYAATQMFVHRIDMFPARFINQAAFLAFAGFPIQVVRTVVAVLITVSLLRVIQKAESERQRQVVAAQQARLAAFEQQEAMRRELLRHIVQAQEGERARIARELHDETAQVLSAFSLELATLRTRLRGNPHNLEMLDHLQELSRQMSQGLYHLVHDLRPAHLDDLGLPPALKYLLEQDCCPKGLEVTFETVGTQQRLDPLAETVLFRVAQEALNNVARHSQTRHARLCLTYEAGRVILQVADRGRGFDPAENFHPPRGWGLAGMRERVESLDGELKITAAPGEGTTIEVVIPIVPQLQKEMEDGSH